MKRITHCALGLLLGSAACGAGPEEDAAPPDGEVREVAQASAALTARSRPDMKKIVPWRAVSLVGPTDGIWEEYDYRPRAEGGHREDIDATLERVRRLGARQVIIQAAYAWSVESAPYPGTTIQSTVYYSSRYDPSRASTWGRVARTRRGDMGLVAARIPAFWDAPKALKGPLEINRRAEAVLGTMLDAVRKKGLIPVLKAESYLAVADDADLLSRAYNFTDPSRNFDKFYAQYEAHLLRMTQLAAEHGAAMVILGSGTPYVAGAGQARFADGSPMPSRQAMIGRKWEHLINAVRVAAADEDREDMAFTYSELNPFWEPRALVQPMAPAWSRVPFWGQLDAVGVQLYLPGRASDAMGTYDRAARTAEDMLRYGETHGFATDLVPNLQDLRDHFVGQRGYAVGQRPVLVIDDGCSATPMGAVNPASPVEMVLRAAPDREEQRRLLQAHVGLARRYGEGWLGGMGFWQVAPSGRFGGPYDAAHTDNYRFRISYYHLLDTPAEDVLRDYFQAAPAARGPELLRNAGFETGTSPWRFEVWGGAPRVAIDRSEGRTGRRSLKITNPDAVSLGAATSDARPVEAGARYRASAQVTIDGKGEGRVVLLLDWYDAGWVHLGTASSTGLQPDVAHWVQDVVEADAPAGAAYVQLHVASYAQGTATIDDVSLRRLGPSPSR